MRVLVCGGRDYRDRERMKQVLTELEISELINGGARGADSLAIELAIEWMIPVQTYHADWKKHGPKAGPIRNEAMLVHGKPDLVVAFPGGRGTADMLRRARAAGVKVLEVKP